MCAGYFRCALPLPGPPWTPCYGLMARSNGINCLKARSHLQYGVMAVFCCYFVIINWLTGFTAKVKYWFCSKTLSEHTQAIEWGLAGELRLVRPVSGRMEAYNSKHSAASEEFIFINQQNVCNEFLSAGDSIWSRCARDSNSVIKTYLDLRETR